MLTYSKIDSYIIPVTASFIGLPVTINGIGTLVLSVCDVNKGKINQHVWQGKELPGYVQREFEEFLQCGRLEHGFLRVRCESCHAEHLVAFSCKRRGFCPSCGARRMAESAALLVDEVLPEQPMRQWVLSFPFQLRFLFGVVCGKGRNPTLRLWPAIFSGEIDVFPGDRRSRLISSMPSVAPA